MQAAAKPTILAVPLLFLLCSGAGSIDATAYLLCGHMFVANMTGGTVLLAISLLQRKGGEAALRGGLIAAFLASVIVARLLPRGAGKQLTRKQRLFVLGVEALLLLLLGWKSTGEHFPLLLLLLAGMLGTQNGAFQYIGGFHLNTTFVTGNLEKLGEALTDTQNALSKTSAFLLSWVGYASGALLGAFGARAIPQHSFLIPMLVTVASALALVLTPKAPREGAGL
jgi:uncharacterized membrane protein YoaK (UPF0700 family)